MSSSGKIEFCVLKWATLELKPVQMFISLLNEVRLLILFDVWSSLNRFKTFIYVP